MEFLNLQDKPWQTGLILLALAACLYIRTSRISLTLHTRRTSTSQTPPCSISPDKKSSSQKTPSDPVTILPPQRRHFLASLPQTAPTYTEVSESTILSNILPMTSDFRTAPDNLYTPTGFSIAEIRALGDFPDYAALSGVPLPEKYEGFDIDRALPRPYRPFRWGYHQTMSLTKLEPNWWLELENTYTSRISQRKTLLATHGPGVLGTLPGSELACKELMEIVIQFLCARYPAYFTLVNNKRMLVNKILGVEVDITSKPPLELLMDHIPEDFGVMMRDDKSGNYFLRAGVICSSVGWNVASKVGKQLHEIHSGIPDYEEKMRFSMDRFFTKMPTEKPIQRGSWGLEIGQPLYMPPGSPHEKLRETQDPNLALSDIHLRVDWQTLRRLPLSGAIVFNFKTLFTPVTEFRTEPGVPALLGKVLREGKENLMRYKGTWHVEHVVLPKLEKWEAEQVGKGLVEGDWEVATLGESPWFRGWEGKWRGQQGF